MDAYYNKRYHVPHTQVILMSKITIVSGHMIRTFKFKYKIWKKYIYLGVYYVEPRVAKISGA